MRPWTAKQPDSSPEYPRPISSPPQRTQMHVSPRQRRPKFQPKYSQPFALLYKCQSVMYAVLLVAVSFRLLAVLCIPPNAMRSTPLDPNVCRITPPVHGRCPSTPIPRSVGE